MTLMISTGKDVVVNGVAVGCSHGDHDETRGICDARGYGSVGDDAAGAEGCRSDAAMVSTRGCDARQKNV